MIDQEQQAICLTGDVEEIDDIDDQVANFSFLLALTIVPCLLLAGIFVLLPTYVLALLLMFLWAIV